MYQKYFGCSIPELKLYLESLFQPGMTWSNHGNGLDKWNVDHIIPCNRFDLSKEEDCKKCWNYTNLQPMWWEENIQKRDNIYV